MSKYDEALKILIEEVDEANCEYGNIRPSALKAVRDIEELVKRATPMKPILRNLSVEYDCPNCAKYVGWMYEKYLFCPKCCQALDWSGETK